MTAGIARFVADNARLVVVVMLVASAVVGAGVPMVERSTSLDQFQTDAAAADAADYVDANFSADGAETTTAQVVIQDENVLDRETLVAVLEYERALRDDETVDETLVETRSVASLVATAAIREDRERANATQNGTTPSDANETRDGTAPSDGSATPADGERAPNIDAQIDALRSRSDDEVERFVGDVLAGDGNRSSQALTLLPDYYEPGSTETNATLLVVTQESPGASFAPGDAPDEIEASQTAMQDLAPDDGSMSVLVYGDGIVSTEITDSMVDSVTLVGPLAIAFVLVVLVVVYRDLLDILLGLAGVALVLVWTFGAMGWAGIPFSQPFVVVLVLLIGLSIDYGLHVVMRYREARAADESAPSRAMAVALGSVGVALVYVTITTVIGFLSNLTSPLGIFRDLGLVSAIGIVATLAVFGLLVPALKVELDAFLEARGVDRAHPAVGTGRGPINRLLGVGATLAAWAPAAVIVVALVVSGVGAYGATTVDASFEQSDFLAEDPDDWLKDLPEPVAPGTYTAERAIDTLEADFVRRDTTASILLRGDVTDPATLDRLDAARATAGDASATETYADGEPAVTDPITVMDRVAAENPSFAATLSAADTDGDGVPDRNVTGVYDELFRVAPDDASNVVHREDGSYEALRMVVTVDGSVDDAVVHEELDAVAAEAAHDGSATDPDGVGADSDGSDAAGDGAAADHAGVTAIATGDVVVNRITADQLAETAITSLLVALAAVMIVLAVAYRLTEGSASLGVVTILPVAATLTWVLGTMALLDIPFNIVTGMITGLTIGLGVDYSLHVSERFVQELAEADTTAAALRETVTGTGGALLSSAATTASGFAVLLVAILPFLQSFGLITALTIVYAVLASVFVLPSLLVVWARVGGRYVP
ncbi:efflux RND transporter permease subunit [Halovivax cerinus]|uniref:RND family transporter n=1 Tax=Halovivax cerinus TaxID=1487865 RepID=A0ABD5NPY6_9EURY|nr:MMPL family transporter [Halovivax cerinus]